MKERDFQLDYFKKKATEQKAPLTGEQRTYLEKVIDPKIQEWMEGINREVDRRKRIDEYYTRTHDYKNYDRVR